MGNKESNESAAVKRQAEGFANPMYRLLDLMVIDMLQLTSMLNMMFSQCGGLFVELSKKAQITGNTTELDEAIRSKVMRFRLESLMFMCPSK